MREPSSLTSIFTIACSPEEVPKGNHQWSLSRSHLPVRPDGSAPLDPLHALNLPLESSRGQLVVFLTQQLASTMVMTLVTARWLKIGKCLNPYLQLCRDDENYDCGYLKVTTRKIMSWTMRETNLKPKSFLHPCEIIWPLCSPCLNTRKIGDQ